MTNRTKVSRLVTSGNTESDATLSAPPSLTSELPSIEIHQGVRELKMRMEEQYAQQPDKVRKGKYEGDTFECVFSIGGEIGLPEQYVYLSRALIDAVGLDAPTTREALHRTLFAARPEHVTSFASDSLNRLNELVFQSHGAFHDIPPLYTNNCTVAKAFAKYFDGILPVGEARIQEVCAGEGSIFRWNYFLAESVGRRSSQLTLADITYSKRHTVIPSSYAGASIVEEHLNLLEPPIPLELTERLDCVMACYGFDSVWLPGDMQLVYHKGRWFEALYRVAVPDWHSSRSNVVEAFRSRSASALRATDFHGLIIERMLVPFPLESYPDISNAVDFRITETSSCVFNVPVGMIQWVKNAFELQLKSTGKIVIADAGLYRRNVGNTQGFLETDSAAQFRSIDFMLAESLLTNAGFSVSITPLGEFVANMLGPNWGDSAKRDDAKGAALQHQYIMEITKSA